MASRTDSFRIDVLLARMAVDDPQREVFQRRAIAYHRDCGCAMGGAFMVVTAALVVLDVLFVHRFSLEHALVGTAAVFVAAALGKAFGLGLAAMRLVVLRRTIVARTRHLVRT